MGRECQICGKKTSVGYQITRRGLAKAKGGVGQKITGRSKRKFRPNLQKVRAISGGTVQRIVACVRCIKSGKIQKPS